MNEPSGTYKDKKAFRRAVEKKAKASVSDPDWSDLLQDRHESFDAADFTEMVNTLREFSVQKSKSSPEGKARGYRLAHVQRAADEAREMVESFRLDLFGHTHPPFSNRAVEAAEWIESKVQEPQTQRLVIEVTTPSNLDLMESIIWCAGYLSRQTESYDSITDYDSAAVARFIKTGENIRSIGFRMPLLEYLGVNSEEELNIKRVQAPDGTFLGRLLQLHDESDNAQINIALTPFITLCRQKGSTLCLSHHTRKGGGEHGEGAAGGHAFLGIVDVALELHRDKQVVRRRMVKGWARVIEVSDLVYEMEDTGTMKLLGDRSLLDFNELKNRVQEVVKGEWQSTKDIEEAIGEPKPSRDSTGRVLEALAKDGKAERDPPISEGPQPGKKYTWKNLTSASPPLKSGGEVGAPDDELKAVTAGCSGNAGTTPAEAI